MNNWDSTEYPLTIPYAMLSCKRFHLFDSNCGAAGHPDYN